MNRQRAGNDLAAEIGRLRLDKRELPPDKAAQAREVAALWMEKDARDCMYKGATPADREGLCAEYRATGFYAESVRVFDNGYRSAE